MDRKFCYTLKDFKLKIMRCNNLWPVGAEIELKDGSIYTVGQINPKLEATNKVVNEKDIVFVRY